MNDLAQLTACVSELAAHASRLAVECRHVDNLSSSATSVPQPLVAETSSQEILQVKQSVAASVVKLQTLLWGPNDFLQHLAHQLQLLSCIQWLGEFQILAFIPLDSSLPLEDIADLASVPLSHLTSVVRLTATAGFLREPLGQAGHVEHTALSAYFVTKLSYLDAAMFLSDCAAPTALHMAKATKHFGHSNNPSHSAYNMARGSTVPFASACDDSRSRLRRQWPAYLKHVVNNADHSGGLELFESLGCFDRLNHSTASVVEVAAESIERAMTLARRYPNVKVTVQMPGSNTTNGLRNLNGQNTSPDMMNEKEVLPGSRVTVSHRALGTTQPIRDASIYMLDLSVPSMSLGLTLDQISAELRGHMDVLRSNHNSALLLLCPIAPGKSTSHPEAETAARLRDLSLFQLQNQQSVKSSELSELIHNTRDRTGGLSIVRESLSRTGANTALEIRYLPSPHY